MSDNHLFDASYARVLGEGVGINEDSTDFFEAFYQHFLKDPQIADAFSRTDMSRQVGMLRKSFFHLVAFYVSHEPSAELERIAMIHYQLHIADSFYDLWLDALVAAVRDFDPDCDLPVELAWRWAMTPGLTYMRLLGKLPAPSDRR